MSEKLSSRRGAQTRTRWGSWIMLISRLTLLLFLVGLAWNYHSFHMNAKTLVVKETPSAPDPPRKDETVKNNEVGESEMGKEGNVPEEKNNSTTAENLSKKEENPVVHPNFKPITYQSPTSLFNPSEFRTKNYRNLPVRPWSDELKNRVKKAINSPIKSPDGLLHEGHPPGHDVVMGIAMYKNYLSSFRRFVGSLRTSGFDGHIILGVLPDISEEEEAYLQKMDVTYYAVELVECDDIVNVKKDGLEGERANRVSCPKGSEDLMLVWGRFELQRTWLNACQACTGWVLVTDTRDIFFQQQPFVSLDPPDQAQHELLFVEEIAPHTNPKPETPHRAPTVDNFRYTDQLDPCYGKDHAKEYQDRAILCSGTIIGTRQGMLRAVAVMSDEFRRNAHSDNEKCRQPHTGDQWTMDYLYYQGFFGYPEKTTTIPWGTGPVMTIGTPCINSALRALKLGPDHSQMDLTEFDDKGYILNNYEPQGSKARIAPSVHQYDRCHQWIHPFFAQHPELFDLKGGGVKDLKPVTWKQS